MGYQTALYLASRGCEVIIGDKVDAEDSVKEIISHTGNDKVRFLHLDLSSFASIRKFVEDLRSSVAKLDVLVNNAASWGLGKELSEDGLLLGMQINHFAPFLLTHLLLGKYPSTHRNYLIKM